MSAWWRRWWMTLTVLRTSTSFGITAARLAKPWTNDPSKAKVRAAKEERLMKYAAHTRRPRPFAGEPLFALLPGGGGEGHDPSMAKRTAARKIMATALVLMKTGAAYDDDAI